MVKKKRRIVKVKAMKGIAEYLHNLTGPVLKARKEPLMKRMPPHNDPKRIGTITKFLVDLSAHSNTDLDTSMSKKFWFEADMIADVTYQIQLSRGHGKAVKGKKKTATIQVIENLPKGYIIIKVFQFMVGNAVSKAKAMKKAENWIKGQK